MVRDGGAARSPPAATGAGCAARVVGAGRVVTATPGRSTATGAAASPPRVSVTTAPAPSATAAVRTAATTGRRRDADRCLAGSTTRGTVPAQAADRPHRPRSVGRPEQPVPDRVGESEPGRLD